MHEIGNLPFVISRLITFGVAVVLGVLFWKFGGKTKSKLIVSLVGITIAGAWLFVFSLKPQSSHSDEFACLKNLRAIQIAKEYWMRDNHKSRDDVPVWDDLKTTLAMAGPSLKCPDGGTYTIGKVGDPPACSIGTHNHILDPAEVEQIRRKIDESEKNLQSQNGNP